MSTVRRPAHAERRGSRPTSTGWTRSTPSRSAHHYDPANTHFGLLLVSNDDIVAPGTGFETHPHRDMEIVTWVLDGALVHQDSEGHNGVIYPGLAQRMSAGTGILHSEKNDTLAARPARRATTTRCTSCRCGSCPTRPASRPATSSSTSTPSWLRGGLVPGRVRAWPRARGRCRDPDRPASTPRCSPRGSAPGESVSCPTRRSCTCTSPAGRRPRGRRRAGSRRRRPHHRRPTASASPPADGAPRSWSGRCTPASSSPDARPSLPPESTTFAAGGRRAPGMQPQ